MWNKKTDEHDSPQVNLGPEETQYKIKNLKMAKYKIFVLYFFYRTLIWGESYSSVFLTFNNFLLNYPTTKLPVVVRLIEM